MKISLSESLPVSFGIYIDSTRLMETLETGRLTETLGTERQDKT